ncbi:hypothetical protein ACIBEJ_24190 [Nonomuraea sp. NPDC050790]|uniref:hypothetical protein n=1 Tax=Nonomuraea sp. NPDC050790 TaxID=3364371 RepID=UPI0037B8B1F4
MNGHILEPAAGELARAFVIGDEHDVLRDEGEAHSRIRSTAAASGAVAQAIAVLGAAPDTED